MPNALRSRRLGVLFAPFALVATVPVFVVLSARADEGDEPDPSPSAESPEAPGTVDTPSSAAPMAKKVPPIVHTPSVVKDGQTFLPGGRFTMGSSDRRSPPNERPPRTAAVAPFWIDVTEVTVQSYRQCVDRHACERPRKTSASCTYDADDPMLPVNCVSWENADRFCSATQKRLPTEAEWEFAARGGHAVRYPWGSSSSCKYAATLLHDATGRPCTKRPARVGSYPLGASIFGVQDLTGNVEEWVSDYYAEHVVEGALPRSGTSHVLRGGGWQTSPGFAKTTSRNWASSLEAGANVGFRCARDSGEGTPSASSDAGAR